MVTNVTIPQTMTFKQAFLLLLGFCSWAGFGEVKTWLAQAWKNLLTSPKPLCGSGWNTTEQECPGLKNEIDAFPLEVFSRFEHCWQIIVQMTRNIAWEFAVGWKHSENQSRSELVGKSPGNHVFSGKHIIELQLWQEPINLEHRYQFSKYDWHLP